MSKIVICYFDILSVLQGGEYVNVLMIDCESK